ncbi:RNA polymerase sigma factor [Oceanobacillus jeddahense]|uniref:RNA polymerase sigma factor n=1 Tax=Oceanobacillus jeddahense TaxID=1462527 RepID=UPI000595F345|nr:sigma-70 family RNA polymerase sigma factor [Oceanobacillus jeddahense]
MSEKKWELEDFIEQNQRRVYYQMARLQIDEEKEEYFQEGLVAMWRAYENYKPDKGPLATYMNFQIRNRIVDVFRKAMVEKKYLEQAGHERNVEIKSGNYSQVNGKKTSMEVDGGGDPQEMIDQSNENVFLKFTALLTEKQKVWFRGAIIEGLSNQEIADREEVSLEAVKSWAKGVKKKLRKKDWDGD